MAYILTKTGIRVAEQYIKELQEKRKEIMDGCKDTCEETELPDVGSIELDVNLFAKDGEYLNNWGVTDHHDSDYPICLQEGIDYVEAKGGTSKSSADYKNINVAHCGEPKNAPEDYDEDDYDFTDDDIEDDLTVLRDFLTKQLSLNKSERLSKNDCEFLQDIFTEILELLKRKK